MSPPAWNARWMLPPASAIAGPSVELGEKNVVTKSPRGAGVGGSVEVDIAAEIPDASAKTPVPVSQASAMAAS